MIQVAGSQTKELAGDMIIYFAQTISILKAAHTSRNQG